MNSFILITGASGVLGRATVGASRKAGFAVRQGVRDPQKASAATEAIRLYDADLSTVEPAVAGMSGLLLMAPSLDPNAPAALAPVTFVEFARASAAAWRTPGPAMAR